MKRQAIALCLALALLLAPAVPAYADALGERVDEWSAQLPAGATLSGSSYWTGDDLRTEYLLTLAPGAAAVPVAVSADPLRAQQHLTEAAAALEAQGRHVLGGVNGGFYTVATGEPVGFAAAGGRLLHDDEGLQAVGFRADGSVIFGSPAISMKLRTETEEWTVGAWNRAIATAFSAYTPDCAKTIAVPEHGLCVFLRVEELPGLSVETKCTILEIREGDGSPVAVPEGTVMLTLPPNDAETACTLPDAFAADAEMTLEITCAPGWEDVESGVGILYPLLENGAVLPKLTASAAPRTAIGQRADGTLLLYALDGRRSGYSVGGGLTDVAERLRELGCVTAGALDGGGSTILAAFLPGDAGLRTFNSPSDGKPRKVANYILLTVPAEPTGQATQLSMEPLHLNCVSGAAVPLTVRAADDAGFGAALPDNLTFTVTDGLGAVVGGQYHAAGAGEGTITVSAPGMRGVSIPVRVTESPAELQVYGEKYGKRVETLTLEPGYEVDLTVRAFDRHIPLSTNDLCYTWELDPEVGTVDETGHLIPGEVAVTGLLRVTAGETAVEIPITVTTGLPFRDVPKSYGNFDAIRYVYEHRIFIGTGDDTFEPETVMNRGMLVTVLWRMEGEPAASQPVAFEDVALDAWYADAVAWAAENGVVNGYGDGRFGPTDDLTREQILTILHRWAGLPAVPEGEDVPQYPDESLVSDWALEAMRWATGARVSVWDERSGPFPPPDVPMTRAAVADVLTRYDTLVRANLVNSSEADGN